MPYVVIKRCPGGPNPDLVPGMRLGDRVRRTLVDAGFVKFFPEHALDKAPPEPMVEVVTEHWVKTEHGSEIEGEREVDLQPAPVPELDHGFDLAKDHLPKRQPKPVPPDPDATFDELVETGTEHKDATILVMRRRALKHLIDDVKMPDLEAEAMVRAMDLEELEQLMVDLDDTAEVKLEFETTAADPVVDPNSGVAQTAAYVAHTHEDAGSSPAPASNETPEATEPHDASQAEPEADAATPPPAPPTTSGKKKAKKSRRKRG